MFWTIVGALLFVFIGIPFILGLMGHIFYGLGRAFLFLIEGGIRMKDKLSDNKTKSLKNQMVTEEENLVTEEKEGEWEITFMPEYERKKSNEE